MDLAQIKELMRAMGRHSMHRLELKEGEFSLTLERGNGKPVEQVVQIAAPTAVHADPLAQAAPPPPPKAVAAPPPEQKEQEGAFIKSPMVGSFYTSPSPDDPVFVKVGDKVSEGTVVCIIEAMKVMNEVKAGVSGTIAEVMIENGHPVEFGSKLFRITPE